MQKLDYIHHNPVSGKWQLAKDFVALTKQLQSEGLKGDKTVRVSFDPQFDWKAEQLWHAIGTDPSIDARYSMKTCEKVSD